LVDLTNVRKENIDVINVDVCQAWLIHFIMIGSNFKTYLNLDKPLKPVES